MLKRCSIVALAMAAFAVACARAQAPQIGQLSMEFPATVHLAPIVTGQPYSAQEISEHTQTLADGTHITQAPRTTQIYRDSDGRTRTERPMQLSRNGPMPVQIEISDPVSGYLYRLDPANHIAHRTKFTGPPASLRAAVANWFLGLSTKGPTTVTSTDSRGYVVTRVTLDPQTIEGLLCQGGRITTVIPVGAEGNDAPITTVSEVWFSQQISRAVLTKSSDPRTGESTVSLKNFALGDPDPTLFQPPAGYEVVDETGPYQIRYTLPAQQSAPAAKQP